MSFLRVEGFHTVLFGEAVGAAIALPSERGLFVHIPLILLSGIIALKEKSVSLVWLTLLVVIAEFLIVVARFIYGYEQTFMGDLVRFWYAALFLFASAYTLKEDGIVKAAEACGFKLVRRSLNQAPFYFSRLIEFRRN